MKIVYCQIDLLRPSIVTAILTTIVEFLLLIKIPHQVKSLLFFYRLSAKLKLY